MSNRKPAFRALIEAAGLTQRETAQTLGVTLRTVQYWLADSSPLQPPPMALDALRWHAEPEAERRERLDERWS